MSVSFADATNGWLLVGEQITQFGYQSDRRRELDAVGRVADLRLPDHRAGLLIQRHDVAVCLALVDQAVADANHVLFFNADEGYQVSHPMAGGDASLSMTIPDAVLAELAPPSLLNERGAMGFRYQYLGIDARAQALVAVLRHTLTNGTAETLEAESLALTLVSRSLGPRTAKKPGATRSHRRLADRVKVLLASDLSRRWSLGEIAREIRGSPVYLTQVFQLTEGMPLYRYHLRLRLARSLDLITRYDDLSSLAAELGFSSHSHFSAAFKQAYGRSPTAFRHTAQ